MRYTGETCPICGQSFTEDADVVVCPDCGTPHHRECYQKNAACANAQRHGTDFSWSPQHPETAQKSAPVTTLQAQKPPQSKPSDGHSIVFCPNCGAENGAEEPVCTQCGTRLYNGTQPVTPPVQLPNGAQTPLGAAFIPPTDTIGGNTVADTAEYVQAGARKYIPKFYKLEKTGKRVSWNWAAFLFTPYWFFYRKLYAVGSALLVLLLAVTAGCTTPRFLEASDAFYAAVAQAQSQMQADGAPNEASMQAYTDALQGVLSCPELYISACTQLAVAVFSGLYANFLYKKKAAKEILRLHAQSSSPQEYRLLLFRRGGVSVLLGLATFWIYNLGSQLLVVAISRFLL